MQARRFPWPGLILPAVLGLSSCFTPDTSSQSAAAAADRSLPPAVDGLIARGYGTQDFIVHVDLRVLRGDEDEGRSVYEQLLAQAERGAGEAVALSEGFQFRPTDSLTAVMRDADGGPLPSIPVDFGLLSIGFEDALRLMDQARAQGRLPTEFNPDGDDLEGIEAEPLLVEFTTADLDRAPVNVMEGDVSDLDVSFLEGLQSGDRLRSVHLWGQTAPPADASSEAGMTPHEVFASRWRDGRVRLSGTPDDGPHLIVDEDVELREAATRTAGPATVPVRLAGVGLVPQENDPTLPGSEAWTRRQNAKRRTFVAGGTLLALAAILLPGAVAGVAGVTLTGLGASGTAMLTAVATFFGVGGMSGYGLGWNQAEKPCFVVLAGSGAGSEYWVVPYGTTLGGADDPFRDVQLETVYSEGRYFNFDPTVDWAENPLPPCGRGTGDIHMETFDGLKYEFQTIGEFVAAEDESGEVAIQLRLTPQGASTTVSVATGVAARVGGVPVAIQLGEAPFFGAQIYIDDEVVELGRGEGVPLGDGGGIVNTGTSYVIGWPDGTAAQVSQVYDHLDLLVRPGAPGGFRGLLANADGDPAGDLVTRDGQVLPSEPTLEEIYDRFGDSWRVTPEESLFHYEPGESTEAFTDTDFPSEYVTLDDLAPDVRADAERRCREAGITGQSALDECTLDVAVTGDVRFALSAARVDIIHQAARNTRGVIEVVFPEGLSVYRWGLVSAADPSTELVAVDGTRGTLHVPPGEYRVTTRMANFTESVVWQAVVQVEPAGSVEVALESGARARFPVGLEPYRWSLVSAANGAVVLEAEGTLPTLLVPPGAYRVTTRSDNVLESLTWPDVIQVGTGELVDLQLGSGIQVDFPPGTEPYRWAVVAADDPEEVLLQVDGSLRTVLTPPGEYRVTTQMENGGASVLSPGVVEVEVGRVAVVRPVLSP